MAVSIVRTQSTKRLALAGRIGRDDVADLDGTVSDDHAVNQQFEQRPFLVEVGACQARANTAAERLGVGCQGGMDLAVPDFSTLSHHVGELFWSASSHWDCVAGIGRRAAGSG